NGDADADGVTNSQEETQGSDPTRASVAEPIVPWYVPTLPSLTHYYAMEETNNEAVAIDRSFSGHDGTIHGNPVFATEGTVQGAMQFDGVDDYISAPTDVDVNLG